MIFTLSIPYDSYPSGIFSLSATPGFVFLDSSLVSAENRYSFLATDPWKILKCEKGRAIMENEPFKKENYNPWDILRKEMALYSLPLLPNLPPFQGGAVGYFSYEMGHYLEKFPYPATDDMEFPDLIMGFYDCVAAFDHQLKKAWIFSSGLPLPEKNKQIKRKKELFGLKIVY